MILWIYEITTTPPKWYYNIIMVNIIMSYTNTCIVNMYSLTKDIITCSTTLDISMQIAFLICFPNLFTDRSNCTIFCTILELNLFVMEFYIWELVFLFRCNWFFCYWILLVEYVVFFLWERKKALLNFWRFYLHGVYFVKSLYSSWGDLACGYISSKLVKWLYSS